MWPHLYVDTVNTLTHMYLLHIPYLDYNLFRPDIKRRKIRKSDSNSTVVCDCETDELLKNSLFC